MLTGYVLSNTTIKTNKEIKMKISMHPGEYLKEVFMVPLKISNQELAEGLNVTPATVSRLVNGKCSLSIEMAKRLSHAFGNSVQQWLNIQNNWDIENCHVNTSFVKKFNTKGVKNASTK
jgi:addiction module HigA family antidote